MACVFHVLHLAPIPLNSVGPPPGGSAAAWHQEK